MIKCPLCGELGFDEKEQECFQCGWFPSSEDEIEGLKIDNQR
jgi:ribosomal protein L37E